jgi:segregation and condensation protein B
MTLDELKAVLEALLFAAPGPVALEEIVRVVPGEEAPRIEEALRALGEAAAGAGRGVKLDRVAGGWRFVTRRELEPWVAEFLKVRRSERLSRAALETLAVVAYRQPVTAPEIAEVRSVDPTATLQTLLERGLVKIAGRKKVVGKPFLYGTTREFLIRFGLDRIEDLPSLEEFRGLIEETVEAQAATAGEAPPTGTEEGGGLEAEAAPAGTDETAGGRAGAESLPAGEAPAAPETGENLEPESTRGEPPAPEGAGA